MKGECSNIVTIQSQFLETFQLVEYTCGNTGDSIGMHIQYYEVCEVVEHTARYRGDFITG
eukprot:m.62822 g.62822  ORF g.62822 m.62822 type:complete len:60 (+) comp11536_c1_seq2:1725-1904(+)